MITLDGASGEGGGQILRTALGLSMATGKPFRIADIRANRAKPGLMRQHLACVSAAAALCGATTDGAVLGSRAVTFEPGPVTPGDYRFAVGSAGSTMLVLQAVLPPLLVAAGPTRLTLEGGTLNPFAPPVAFVEQVLLPIVRRMGGVVSLTVDRHGFFPAGGGRVRIEVEPGPLRPVDLLARGPTTARRATAYVAGLPRSIADRELNRLRGRLGLAADELHVESLPDDQGPGNAVTLRLDAGDVTEVISGFGTRGVPAEAVADGVADEAERYLAAGAPVGPHLADQLLVFMALAGGGAFATGEVTPHTTTNAETIGRFLPARFDLRADGTNWRVGCGPG